MTDTQRTDIKRRCLELLHEPDDVVSVTLIAALGRDLLKCAQDCRM